MDLRTERLDLPFVSVSLTYASNLVAADLEVQEETPLETLGPFVLAVVEA